MPELRQIVKNMVDAGEDEAAIASVIKRHNELNRPPDLSPEIPPAPFTGDRARRVSDNEPGTFWGGVGKSFRSGEAFGAGLEGGKGYLKGAVLDLPSSLAHGAKDLLDFHLNPGMTAFRMAEGAREIPGIVEMAGSDPEPFGRLMGQLTGQPAVMEGALAGAGAIGRAARLPASKIMESVGGAMEGSRAATAGVPYTKTGAIAKIAGRTIAPIGRGMRQAGENIRLRHQGVQSPIDLTRPINPDMRSSSGRVLDPTPLTPLPPDNPYTNIINGNRGYRGEADPIFRDSPIVESANDLAARGGGTNPASPFESRGGSVDIDPIFRNPPKGPPPSGAAPALIKEANRLSPEEQIAAAIEEVRNRFSRETDPTTQAPPDPYSLGSNAPPAQPRVSVRTPKPNKSPLEHLSLEQLYKIQEDIAAGRKPQIPEKPKTASQAKNPPTEAKFEPSVDPAAALKDVDPVELKAALEKMKARDAGVDPATGEILPPKRAKVSWRNPFERLKNETGAVGRDIGDIIERQAAEKSARATAPRPTANMPDWGSETIRAPRPVNPLRPEVPEGQVTNRQMIERSDQVAAGNRPNPAQKFADEVLGGNEYSEDMLLTPDELRNPDIPIFNSPFENQFDPRISGLPPRPNNFGEQVSEVMPTRKQIGRDLDENHVTPKGNEVMRQEALARATDAEIQEVVNLLNKDRITREQSGAASTASQIAEARRIEMEARNRGITDIIPEPFQNPNIRPTPGRMIEPKDWGDWGGAEKDLPTLVNDESGSTVAAPAPTPKKSSFSDKVKKFLKDETGEGDIGPPEEPRLSTGRPHPTNEDSIHDLNTAELNEFAESSTNRNLQSYAQGALRERNRSVAELGNQPRYEPSSRPRNAPERDIRFDAETESYFDRNTRDWDEVPDATHREMVRARGINRGTIPDPTVGRSNPDLADSGVVAKGKTLDEFENARKGSGLKRLGSLFGEERANQLRSGEKTIAQSKEGVKTPYRRDGKKQIDKGARKSWSQWADDHIAEVDYDRTKPGLTVGGHKNPDMFPKYVEMQYRNADGLPQGVLRTDNAGTGISELAVDSRLGLRRGKIVFEMLKKAFDQGITEPAGVTSPLTKNLIERVKRLASSESGEIDVNYAVGQINKLIDKVSNSKFGEGILKFMKDETGSGDIGPPKKSPSVGDRSWDVMHPSGKPIGNLTVTRAEIAAARKGGHVPDGMADVDVSNAMFDQKLKNLALEHGYSVNDMHRLRINYQTKAAKEGKVSINPTGDNPARKSTPIGPQGKSYRITSKDDEHLGDITIDPKDVQELVEKHDMSPDNAHMVLYEDKVEDLLIAHGRNVTEVGSVKGEIMNANQKKVRSTAEPQAEPTPKKYDITGKEVKAKDTSKLVDPKTEKLDFDPDRAFEPGGDIQPVAQAASKLEAAKAPDNSFKRLLPKEMQYALEEGETFKNRLTKLIDAVADADLNPVDMREVRAQLATEETTKMKAAAEARQMSEINKFLKSIHETLPDSTVPLLDLKKINLGSLGKGKLNQNPREWVSPSLTRQNPAIARKYKGAIEKKNKK